MKIDFANLQHQYMLYQDKIEQAFKLYLQRAFRYLKYKVDDFLIIETVDRS